MAFKVGQRIRVVKSRYGFEGRLGTVLVPDAAGSTASLGHYRGPKVEIDGIGTLNPHREEMVAPPGWVVPVDGDADYKRFMECVMKPVDLGRPVSA